MEKSLTDLIARLPIPGLKESTDRHIIAGVLTEALSIPVKAKQIQFKEGVVSVSVPPVVKSAIQIRQQILQATLKEKNIVITSFR